jgi:hypothetical protein
MKEQKIRRGDAARLLDKILVELAAADTALTTAGDDPEYRALAETLSKLQGLVERAGLTPLQPCHSEAQSNPMHHDNCMACAPRWGFTGPMVKIT